MYKQFNPDRVVVSVSGGKDSAALMQWAVDNFPKDKLVCVHAKIDIDWKETVPVVEAQCAHFDLPLTIVEAVDKNGGALGVFIHPNWYSQRPQNRRSQRKSVP